MLYRRCLINEHEVISMLSQLGFEIIYAEHLSLSQQQQLFEETK
jgi:capsular polysaccharide biosynthesis protein